MSYSPALAICTAIFEITIAIWALRGPGRRPIVRTTCAILLLLAAYQIVEVLVCSSSLSIGFMPQLAFIVVTWLPPLGLLLVAQLSPSQTMTNYAISYFMLAVALGIVVWIAFDSRFVSDSVCNVVYAKYSTPLPRFRFYGWFYWIGLFGMIALSAWGVRASRDAVQQKLLKHVLYGSLGFIVPAVLVTRYVAPGEGALPSILCHFALILAVFLARLLSVERKQTHRVTQQRMNQPASEA